MVGAGDVADGSEPARLAEAVGTALAERGAVVVCGGRGGVMAAVCRGAAAAGGVSVGILPGRDRSEANPWVTVAVATGLGEARNAVVASTADAVIAVGGEWGTLSEIALARKLGTPVVLLRSWELRRDGAPPDGVTEAGSAEEAVTVALGAISRRR